MVDLHKLPGPALLSLRTDKLPHGLITTPNGIPGVRGDAPIAAEVPVEATFAELGGVEAEPVGADWRFEPELPSAAAHFSRHEHLL